MSIYKSYDIRGVYPSELDESTIEAIGRAFVAYRNLQGKTLVVAKDGRTHSPSLFAALVKGLTHAGANVIDVGLATTPLFYYGVFSLEADAGIIVTASHNPSKYNGLKFTEEEAKPFGGEDIQKLREIVEANEFADADVVGKVEQQEILASYIDLILSKATLSKDLKLVIDTGNGMGIHTAKPLVEKACLQASFLYDEIDMSFPNHEANPLNKATLDDLRDAVVAQSANLGVAFDGDADRVGFIDEKGQIVPMDLITALIGEQIAKNQPGAGIVYDIRSSWAVQEHVKKAGGKPIESMVGHTNIKKLMRKEGAVFGGEVSGHYYHKEMNVTDNALLTMVKVLSIMSSEGKPISELLAPFMTYFKSDETNFEVDDKDGMIAKIKAQYADGSLNELDGIRIDYDDWWFNVRKSNTEPLLRLIIEAKTKERMEEKLQEISQIITAA